MEKKVVIIGAGLSGLTAGIYARLAGFETEIYEKHTIAGGECTGWDRKGYHIDNCIHWLMGCVPGSGLYDIWRTVHAITDEGVIQQESMYTSELDGQSITLWKDVNRTERELLTLSPEDEAAIKDLMKYVRLSRKVEIPCEKPNELMGIMDGIHMMKTQGDSLKIFKHYKGKDTNDLMNEFKHPLIRCMISDFVTKESKASSFVMAYGSFVEGNGGVPKGGSRAMALRMKARFEELGGKLYTNRPVKKIILDGEQEQIAREASKSDEQVSSREEGQIEDQTNGRKVSEIGRQVGDKEAGWITDQVNGGRMSRAANQADDRVARKLDGQVSERGTDRRNHQAGHEVTGSAAGILLENGEFVKADYVVPACDTDVTFRHLLDESYMDPVLREMYDQPEVYPIYSMFQAAYAVDSSEDVLGGTEYIIPVKDLKTENWMSERITIKNYSYEPSFAPEGKQIIQILWGGSIEAYDFFKALYKDKDKYNVYKNMLASKLMEKIEERFPIYKGKMSLLDVWTPMTYERYCSAFKGYNQSFMPTKKSKALAYPSPYVKGLDNVILAGQWITPPGGCPGAAIQGKYAIMRIMHKEKRAWDESLERNEDGK